MLHAVIMAGGSGTRFWPESRKARPKQLLRLAGERTMIQATLDRLGGLVPAERVLVMAGAAHVPAIREQLAELPASAVFGEPCKRDTAPCIGLAALLVMRDDPDATMVVMPADHVIRSDESFRRTVAAAAALVERHGDWLVTIGIRPTYPAESFGYIERGDALAGDQWDAPAGLSGYRVLRFREKPDRVTAAEFLASGRFYWNSGLFVWKARTILDELSRCQPQMFAHLEAIGASLGGADAKRVLSREFAAIEGKSIDYAVMERADRVVVIEAPFEWDDVGSWPAVARLNGADAQGNTVSGRHVGLRTEGSIIRAEDNHLVATLGVRDLVIVHTPDATLVADKHDEEAVRQLIRLIEERGWEEYL